MPITSNSSYITCERANIFSCCNTFVSYSLRKQFCIQCKDKFKLTFWLVLSLYRCGSLSRSYFASYSLIKSQFHLGHNVWLSAWYCQQKSVERMQRVSREWKSVGDQQRARESKMIIRSLAHHPACGACFAVAAVCQALLVCISPPGNGFAKTCFMHQLVTAHLFAPYWCSIYTYPRPVVQPNPTNPYTFSRHGASSI